MKKEVKEIKEEWEHLDAYKEIQFKVGDRLSLQLFKTKSETEDLSPNFTSESISTATVYIGFVVRKMKDKNVVTHFVVFHKYEVLSPERFTPIERIEKPFVIPFYSNGFSYKNTENGVETYQSFHVGNNVFNLIAAERPIGEYGKKIVEEMGEIAKQLPKEGNWTENNF